MGDQVVTVDDLLRRQRGSILRGRSARATVLTGEAAKQFYKRTSRVYGVGRSAIPLGTPISLSDVKQPTITSLPPLAPRPVRVTTGQIPIVPIPSGRQPATPNQAVVPAQPIKKETAMDLSNILGQVTDIARTYYGIRQMRTPSPYTGPIMAQPVIGGELARRFLGQVVPGAVGGAIGGFLSEPDVPSPFVAPSFPSGGGAMPLDVCKPSDVVYQWDECSQTYVPKKKRKRRRRQLVTKGDIKGLAALKGVVGTGKIMETWIATHG